MNSTEKLAVLQKVRLLALGAMQTLNPTGNDPVDLDMQIYGIWLEFQSALMGAQEAICKIAVKDMEEDRDGN